MANKILTLALEFRDLRSKWQTLSLYERFEQTVVAFLTLVIAIIVAIATWQLLLHTLRLAGSHATLGLERIRAAGGRGRARTVTRT